MAENRSRRRRIWPWALLAIVVVVVVAGVLALDALLLSRARAYAADYGRTLGREITIGGVRTKFLGGLGVKVSDVSVGPGPGEDAPILQLRRAEVEADLLRAIRTGGKQLHVREAVLEGLSIQVIRFPDGTTNAERLAKKLAEQPREKEAAKEEGQPADLSGIQVGRAAVENARIAFRDEATRGAKELAIEDLDLEVKDLAGGAPLLVTLRAAVLAQQQNLALDLRAPPLPSTLVPVPESLTLKVEPAIDLSPLAPFVPASVGLTAGRFQANLAARLGGAVPGGSGPVKLAGDLRALGLAFKGAEGGRALDVVLDVDLDADAQEGSLRIGKLLLTAGPVRIAGQGRATGLLGSAPAAEGLTVTGEGLDPAALAAYYPPLREVARKVAGPAAFTLRGSGSGEAARVELRVDLAPVRLALPDAAAKAAGAPMSLLAHVSAAGGGARVRFDATADLAGLDLRPGGSLAKGPGDPLVARAEGVYRRTGPGASEVTLTRMDLDLMGQRLTGNGKAALASKGRKSTTTFDLALSGDALDLDRILLAEERPKPAKKEEPPDPTTYQGLSGTAQVKLGKVRMKKLDFQDVVARVRLVEDEVTVEEARLNAFGGRVSAAGTRMKLAHPDAPMRVAAELQGVQIQQALGLFSSRQVLSGTVQGKIDLTAAGASFAALAPSLTGVLSGALQEGVFHGKDLVASVAQPLSKALPFAGGKLAEGGTTQLGKNLPFSFHLANGLAKLDKPLTVDRPEGNLSVGGGVRLDGTLDMPATFALSPELVARITGGRAKPAKAIPVAFRLTGPAWKPSIVDLQLRDAAEAIVREAGSQAIGKALGVNGSLDEAAAKKRAEAEAAARAKQQEVAQQAGAKAAEAKQKAAQEVEDARKKAEEEAKKRLKGLFGR